MNFVTHFGPIERHQNGNHRFRDLGIRWSGSGERRKLFLVGWLAMRAKLKAYECDSRDLNAIIIVSCISRELRGHVEINVKINYIQRATSRFQICIGFLGWSITRLESDVHVMCVISVSAGRSWYNGRGKTDGKVLGKTLIPIRWYANRINNDRNDQRVNLYLFEYI